MMCYKDMTFCSGDGCTAFDRCHRALTDKVKEDAARWWGGDNAPIAQFLNPKENHCYVTTKSNDQRTATRKRV